MAHLRNISQLIFVIGFPRSGTTWFSNLINSHPETIYRHEVFGREYAWFGDELFRKLKFNGWLSEDDYQAALGILLQARVASDRPPFFRKRFRTQLSAGFQKFGWLAATASPLFAPIYTRLFTPRYPSGAALVIKETGLGVHFESIIKGVRADKLVILIRHPYAVIASHLVGQSGGKLPQASAEIRRSWLRHHAECPYIVSLRLSEEEIVGLDEVEYLAIRWRVQNTIYLEARQNSRVVLYDEFVRDPVSSTEALFQFLDLEFDMQVRRFVFESTSSSMGSSPLARDASSEYYSVYRAKEFDPHKWREVLTAERQKVIDRHTIPLVQQLGLNRWINPASSSNRSGMAV